MTVPILPLVNKTAAMGCSFPVPLYGKQRSVNPYVHPGGIDCESSLAADGT